MIIDTSTEKYAHISLGVDRDLNGNPLVRANGILLGTVSQVKDALAGYEEDDLAHRVVEIVRTATRRGELK